MAENNETVSTIATAKPYPKGNEINSLISAFLNRSILIGIPLSILDQTMSIKKEIFYFSMW